MCHTEETFIRLNDTNRFKVKSWVKLFAKSNHRKSWNDPTNIRQN